MKNVNVIDTINPKIVLVPHAPSLKNVGGNWVWKLAILPEALYTKGITMIKDPKINTVWATSVYVTAKSPPVAVYILTTTADNIIQNVIFIIVF